MAPRFHAATKAMRKVLWEAYALFVAAFREAAELLRAGDRKARFPVGSFPPGKIADQYRKAYTGVDALGDEFQGWEGQGSWPKE